MCERCNSTGFVTYYDWVPYGDTYVRMPVEDACPDCLDHDICPKCGEPLMWEGDFVSCSAEGCTFSYKTC